MDFPPQNALPLLWAGFGLVTLSEAYSSYSAVAQLRAKESVRQAESEVWGLERVLLALDTMIVALRSAHGDEFVGWFNAAPALLGAGALERALLPGLRSESADVVDGCAEVLCELARQRRVRDQLARDPRVLAHLAATLAKWADIDCLDCGNPAPAMSSVLAALDLLLQSRATAGESKAAGPELDQLIQALTRVAAKVEAAAHIKQRGRARVLRRSLQLGGSDKKFEISTGPVTPSELAGAHSADWYLDAAYSVLGVCEALSRKNPERSAELLGAFNALQRSGLFPLVHEAAAAPHALRRDPTVPSARAAEEEVERTLRVVLGETDVRMLELALRIGDALKAPPAAAAADGGDTTAAEQDAAHAKARRAEQRHFERHTAPLLDAARKSTSLRAIRFFAKVEDLAESVATAIAYTCYGAVWGALRTWIALRKVEHPAALTGSPSAVFSGPNFGAAPPAPTFAGAPPPAGSYAAMQLAAQQQAANAAAAAAAAPRGFAPHHPAQASPWVHAPQMPQMPMQPGSVPAGWRSALVWHHSRLAALGACMLVTFHELHAAGAQFVWTADPTKQIAIAVPKVALDLTMLLVLLRQTPYCFAPYLLYMAGSSRPDHREYLDLY